jgi:hypothetical protein
MWSLTSKRERRASGPENFQPSGKQDFFNTIGTKRTHRIGLKRSAVGDRPEVTGMGQNDANDPELSRLSRLFMGRLTGAISRLALEQEKRISRRRGKTPGDRR